MCVTYNSTGLILNKKVHRATLNHSLKIDQWKCKVLPGHALWSLFILEGKLLTNHLTLKYKSKTYPEMSQLKHPG